MKSSYKFIFYVLVGILTLYWAIPSIIYYNTYLAFWVAAIVEVAIAFLEEKVEKRQRINENYNRRALFILTIICFAIGTPITLSYAIDGLESIRMTWLFYILTLNYFGLYEIIKKERT